MFTPEIKTVWSVLALFYAITAGIGLFCYLRPAKQINGLFGYRTGSSMKNQANWNFAQHIFPRYLLKIAHGQLVVSLLVFLLLKDHISFDTQMLIHILVFCFSLVLVISLVERRLARFQKQQHA